MKRIIGLVLLMSVVVSAKAKYTLDSLNYTFKMGYNIGGTAPVGMPVSIRKLNSYTMQPSITLGLDVWKDLHGSWGALVGVHIENKGMKTDATVKNYHMEMVRSGERLEGMFTGRVVTECNQWSLTIPVQAIYHTGRWLLKAGPYLSYIATGTFKGHVYDGYLREGNPTGNKVEMGPESDSSPTYDFSDDMRKFQWGVAVGADYRIGQRIGISADVQWGLNGVFNKSFKTIEQTLYPIYGTIGISYKLK